MNSEWDGPVVSRQEPDKDPTVLEPEDTVENRGDEGVDLSQTARYTFLRPQCLQRGVFLTIRTS